MTRSLKIGLFSFATTISAILFLVYGCEHITDRTAEFPAPIGNVAFHSFSVLEWITAPRQEIRINLQQQSDLGNLVNLQVFGSFQPEMTDETVIQQFGKPEQSRTDDFGGEWSKYLTPLGYVELGFDKRTSSTEGSNPVIGRRSLRGYTAKPVSEIFRPLLLSVLEDAERMTPRASTREFNFFNRDGRLVLDIWIKRGQIEHMELFQHVDR